MLHKQQAPAWAPATMAVLCQAHHLKNLEWPEQKHVVCLAPQSASLVRRGLQEPPELLPPCLIELRGLQLEPPKLESLELQRLPKPLPP